ncbi:UspA domain-containing protein [Actibacterium atlanticum]|uniref:UspA domain-containing protein n=1 Tax=Actibacterium atlanticum TaxID=1461693 RepID=A0A058ZJ40_9RHOB|nr:universal stress protein [Actibacterium atlanticum]KCV81210.1 UspA domain-containing protein [Actibacterium atlanticum]
MAFKTLLTIVNNPDLQKSALEQAIAMAIREDAHLDILCLGLDRTQTGYYYAGVNATVMQETLKRAQEDAEAAEAAVKARMAPETVRWSSEACMAQVAGLSQVVARRAMFSDMVILPKPYGDNRGIEDEAAIEAALFNGKTPVLVMPEKAKIEGIGKRIVIGWNQSAEALAALRAALPLLQQAEMVNIAVVDPPQHGPDRSDPGGLVSQWLGRHGVRTEISVLAKTMPRISDVLARHVNDMAADSLIMGAYGHSRLREAILGGATRNMMENCPVPVLMAH